MAVNANDLREYLNLSPDDDENLDRYIKAAKSKARAAGIPDYKHNAQYDDFILALAGVYYENRALGFSGTYQATAESNARKLINSFVLELRYAGEDFTEETEADELEEDDA